MATRDEPLKDVIGGIIISGEESEGAIRRAAFPGISAFPTTPPAPGIPPGGSADAREGSPRFRALSPRIRIAALDGRFGIYCIAKNRQRTYLFIYSILCHERACTSGASPFEVRRRGAYFRSEGGAVDHLSDIWGDYGWSMDSDTPQGIDAVEFGPI